MCWPPCHAHSVKAERDSGARPRNHCHRQMPAAILVSNNKTETLATYSVTQGHAGTHTHTSTLSLSLSLSVAHPQIVFLY